MTNRPAQGVNHSKPEWIWIFSGKRKSGKDYVTDNLQKLIGKDKCAILRLSAPLKEQYAKENGIDYTQLLEATTYKERYRTDMIRWGEDKRKKNPEYFCDLICRGPGSEMPLWIISDARRKTDISFFQENYPQRVKRVRVEADKEIRTKRGWVFTAGVDDAESECGLDKGISWDVVIENNGDQNKLDQDLATLVKEVIKYL